MTAGSEPAPLAVRSGKGTCRCRAALGAEIGTKPCRELRSEAPRWTIPGRTALRGTIWSIPYRLSPNTLRGWPRHGSAGCQAQCEAHIHPRYSTASTVQPPVPQGHQQRCRPWQGRQRVWPMGRSRGGRCGRSADATMCPNACKAGRAGRRCGEGKCTVRRFLAREIGNPEAWTRRREHPSDSRTSSGDDQRQRRPPWYKYRPARPRRGLVDRVRLPARGPVSRRRCSDGEIPELVERPKPLSYGAACLRRQRERKIDNRDRCPSGVLLRVPVSTFRCKPCRRRGHHTVSGRGGSGGTSRSAPSMVTAIEGLV